MISCFRKLLSIIFLLVSVSTFANDSSYVKFNFVDSLSTGKFGITIYDGIQEHRINPQNIRAWHGELFAPYGLIVIAYEATDTNFIVRKAFFEKGSSEVFLIASPIAGQHYSIDERSSINIIPYSKMGGAAYDAFTKEKIDAFNTFYHKNKNSLGRDTLLVKRAFALADSVRLKKMEFIRQFPELYISFFAFATEGFAKANDLSPKELMEFYNTVLPDKFKKSKAGDHLAGIIRNKIALTSKNNFPDFSVVDMNGNKIELSKLRGNYVLIQFWASWCIPCIAEVPDLKKINDKYGSSAFKLISFSIDKSLSSCRKAIEKNGMNWAQVMGDDRLYNSLGYVSIPQLYLIDKTGRTIYNSKTINDTDLTLLKKLLSEHLGQ
ncbi:TlpA disulfide reductase family protein [Chitinophaga niabensis]|uniref:TlpA family protein disulfide reductase n=1 Tax=Chitinophaga niabensis TaxID=536979 RepID=UPI0031BBA683